MIKVTKWLLYVSQNVLNGWILFVSSYIYTDTEIISNSAAAEIGKSLHSNLAHEIKVSATWKSI